MIDVTFNESLQAALCEMMDPSNVYSIGLYLDMGDITEPFDSAHRKDSVKKMFAFIPFTDGELEEMFERQSQNLKNVIRRISHHESIRVWIDSTPESLCGLCHLCYVLQDQSYTLEAKTLEKHVKDDTHNRSWKEVLSNDLVQRIGGSVILNESTKEMYAHAWETLRKENAPLRVSINGELTSVNETFYDFLIDKWSPQGTFTVAYLIGTILIHAMPGLSDAWLYHRIQHYIETNQFIVVEPSTPDALLENPYSQVIQRTSHLMN